jgi:integrase
VNDAQIRALRPTEKKYRRSVGGGGLSVEVYPNGGKYFVWRHRFPPERKGKQCDYQIGPYGSGATQWSLAKARQERDRLEVLRREGKNPKTVKLEAKGKIQSQCVLTFEEAVDQWRANAFAKLSPTTTKDYENKIKNQILPLFGKRCITTITREDCIKLKDAIAGRGAKSQSERVFMVLRLVFDFAIDRHWIQAPNPASSSRHTKSDYTTRNYPILPYSELPQFLSDLSDNKANGCHVTVACLKVLLLTFMRCGGIVPAKWDEINWEAKIWTIPSDNMKARKRDKQDHLIPMADKLIEILSELRAITGHTDYVFYSPRGNSTQHINKSSPNSLIKRMGYGGKLVSHSFRAMANTIGIDQLKYNHEVIDLQLGHKKKGKVERAYNRAEMLEERTAFMNDWAKLLVKNGLR